MPTKKKASTKASSSSKKRSTNKKKPAVRSKAKKAKPKKSKNLIKLDIAPEVKQPEPAKVCRACNVLPSGSVELVSLLLVLVFSLTAVLLTSVYALETQQDTIETLRDQVRR